MMPENERYPAPDSDDDESSLDPIDESNPEAEEGNG